MKNVKRIAIFAIGFGIGCILVGVFRIGMDGDEVETAEKEREGVAKGLVKRLMESDEGVPRPLPSGSPDYLRESRLLGFHTVPGATGKRFIWLLEIIDAPKLPPIRVVEEVGPEGRARGFRVTAADRVQVQPAEGTDEAALKARLRERGYRLDAAFETGWYVVTAGEVRPLTVDIMLQRLAPENHPWLVEAKPYPILRR
jgi:hypothetical protein